MPGPNATMQSYLKAANKDAGGKPIKKGKLGKLGMPGVVK